MDLNALLAGLITALKHLDETTRERDQLAAELAKQGTEIADLRRDIEALKPRPRKRTKR